MGRCLLGLVLVCPSGHDPRPVDLLSEAFQGIAFGDTVAEVTRKLDGQCTEQRTILVEDPSLPLARETQTHIVALGVDSVGVDEAAFAFGDDGLVQVEVRGGAVDALLPALDEEPVRVHDYTVWLGARIIAHQERDVVWFLTEEGLHPHLFLWENPDLPSVGPPGKPYERSAAKPDILDFGRSLEDLLPRMKAVSAFTTREDIGQPWLPTKPVLQTQINCYGVAYAGFPRKIEAVFGDEKLQLAWILTAKAEEARVRKALVEAYGPAEFVSTTWEAFDGWRVALRKDKPEVLMIADELIPFYRESIRSTGD